MNHNNRSQSSENESLSGDMSYLYGRDPSILTYGQRPFPSQESKRNLISLLEEEKEDEDSIDNRDKNLINTDSQTLQTIKVFLRMKPYPCKMKITSEQLNAYTILNSSTLLTKMPSLDNNTSCLKKIRINDTICRKFIFTRTFGPETSQLQLFEEAVKPRMLEFLTGKNSVVMSYGTTNSGKTYTLQGTTEFPGIIPRGIEFVFSNINPRGLPFYKPVNLYDVIPLSNQDCLQEMDLKMKLLTFNVLDKNCHANTYTQMQRLLQKESLIRPSQNDNESYSVWISFAEIYNETIYDLLWNDCQKKRPPLKLVTDSQGRAFIKGLKNICVNSGAEAYQLLMTGQYNLKVAATALNARSSRSHCIFTIKLLKYKIEHNPPAVIVSTFTFCDLAGSERLKKTLNVGERLKEAQNINTSLLVLGRCLKTIYESQCSTKQKNESIGPFRESKLTRLFQRALSGKEQLALIVNVNPVPNLYVETQNVLNFSAIAKKIVIERANIVKQRHSHSRFSRLVTQSMKTDMDWENTEVDDMTEASERISEEDSEISENDQMCENLLIENEMLKKEIQELKDSILTRDMQTRQEMTDMYSDIMRNLETDWKNRMMDMEEQQEDLRELAVDRIELFYKEKLNQLNSRKRSHISNDVGDKDNNTKLLEDFEVENTCLLAKIESMKKCIRDLKHTKEAMETEKSKISFELIIAKEEVKRSNEMLLAVQKSINSGENIADNYIQELTNMCKKKDDRIKTMKTFLNEAKEEYIFITEQTQKMENQIKMQNKLLVKNMEHIRDLKEQLTQSNIYSAEQSKLIENLEEELEQQLRKTIETEKKVMNLEDNKYTEKNNHNEDDNKSFIEDIKLKLELSENENKHLKEKLNLRIIEIQLLKNNLDSSKNELNKVTEKVNHLIIKDLKTNLLVKQNMVITIDQEIQTEAYNFSSKDPPETNFANISCQENAMNQLQNKNEKMKQIVEGYNFEKEVQKQYEEIIKDKQIEINLLIAKEQELNEKMSTLQNEFEEILQKFEEDKRNFKDLIEVQDDKNKYLMDQIKKTLSQEHNKDNEIFNLQKEMKSLIQSNDESTKKMENEMKNILKELTLSKEQLIKTEERNKKMDRDYKQVIQILEIKIGNLEEKMLEKKVEIEKLKSKNEELRKNLDHTKYELQVFTRNRNETVAKYEDLVKSQYDELDFHRKEVTRLQDVLREFKENCITTCEKSAKKSQSNLKEENKKVKALMSEATNNFENHNENNRMEKFIQKKEFLTPNTDKVPLIELSGSESKKLVVSANKELPLSMRKTRKKRLFTPLDESFIEIEKNEPSPSSSSTTRNLRNRKNK